MKYKYTKILVTGVSGAGTTDVLKNLIGELGQAQSGDGSDAQSIPRHHEIGGKIETIAKDMGLSLRRENILSASPDTLLALGDAAVSRIKRDIDSHKQDIHFVDAHATFLLSTGLIGGISYSSIRRILRPDLLVTIIDAPQAIHSNLKEQPSSYFDLTVENVVKWQEVEVFVTDLCAQIMGKPHFVVPRRDAVEIIRSLLDKEHPKSPIYASYPMTELAEQEKKRVKHFVDSLKEDFIVFDPASIESAHSSQTYYLPNDKRAINAHTIIRDLNWFIGIDSEKVIAYTALRETGNQPYASTVPSSGSNDELTRAYLTGKETYIVMGRNAGDRLPRISPFTSYKAKLFVSEEDFAFYLKLSHAEKAAYDVVAREMAALRRGEQEGDQENTHGSNDKTPEFAKECKRLCEYHLTEDVYDQAKDRLSEIIAHVRQQWSVPSLSDDRSGSPTTAQKATINRDSK